MTFKTYLLICLFETEKIHLMKAVLANSKDIGAADIFNQLKSVYEENWSFTW